MRSQRILAAVTGALALGLGLAACGNDTTTTADPGTQASTSPAAAAGASSSACPNGSLRFAVEPYDDAAKLLPAYQKVAQDLGSALGCDVQLQISDSYVAEILAMKNGQLDLGEFGPAGYVFASQQAGAIPAASFADQDGKLSTYTAGIWVPKGSSITDLKGLAGHTLALGETGSTSGDWEPRYALTQAGVQGSVTTQYAGGHPEAMEALEHGKVDAAEINSQTEASAQKAGQFDPSQYTEIWKSAPIANDPITLAPSLSPGAQATIKKALLNLPASDFNVGGDSSIATELDFTPPSSGSPLVAVTQQDYSQLFDLAKALNLTSKDL